MYNNDIYEYNKICNYAIILASGKGERCGYNIPKQFIKIAGKTVLEHTLNVFENNKNIDKIIIVINPDYRNFTEEILLKNNYSKILSLLNGGCTRQESSKIGVFSIQDQEANVLIHDAVRPLISDNIINNCIEYLKKYDVIDTAISTSDTIIKRNDDFFIDEIPNRNFLMRGQTPQAFKLSLIKQAHKLAENDASLNITDDCGLVLHYNLAKVFIIKGEESNIKITMPEDISIVDKLFQIRKSYFIEENISLNNLKSKIVVIFGASKGIGLSCKKIAENFGAKVYSFSKSGGLSIENFSSIQNQLEKIFNEEGKIDIVINSVGILKIGKLVDRDINDINQEINVNYIGSVNVAKASYKYLKESKGNLIFFTSSSYTKGRGLYSVYSSSKAALVNLTQALSEEFYNDEIRVNIINPERTNTPMRWNNFGFEPKETLLSPDVVAEITLKVSLSNITGQIIDVRRKNDKNN